MSQLGRISGHLLEANLLRNNVDLAFETDLLYLDVNSNRVGIKTTPGIYDLDINDTARSTDLDVTGAVNIYNIIIDASGTFTTSVGPINLIPAQTSPYIFHGQLITDDLNFNDNVISSFSNSNIEFRPNASGTTELKGNTNIDGNLRVYGTYPAQGNITLDGNLGSASNIIVGDSPLDTVDVQTDFTQDIEPGTTLTYDLGTTDKRWAELHAVDETTVNNYIVDAINVSTQLRLDGIINKIYALQSDDDVIINPNTGIVYIETGPSVTPTTGLKFQDVPGGPSAPETLDNPNAYSTSLGDTFARSSAVSASYIIVGAPAEKSPTGLTESGVAYIYDASTRTLLHTLTNPNAYGTATGDYFGYPVDISESYAIVGAYREDDASGSDSGKAYIYSTSSGSLLYTLDNPNAYSTSSLDVFGWAVAISESYAIVGAYREGDSGGSQSGKAYIYSTSSGSLLYTLDNPNAYSTSANDNFGYDVDITESYAIVSALGEDDASGGTSGKAYIYSTATGALLHTLDNPNAIGTSANDNFGWSVAISESYAIVGAPYEDEGLTTPELNAGKAYIFSTSTGTLLHTLSYPDRLIGAGNNQDRFALTVDISESYAIVGAQFSDADGVYASGNVYIYSTTTGELLYSLNNPNAYSTGTNDYFGSSLGITDSHFIVGAYQEGDPGGAQSGKAYFYTFLDGTPTITNLHSTDPLTFASTGIGYVKFEGTNGVVIPSGTDAQRPARPEIGDTRWNTDEGYLECFAGEIESVSVAGSISGLGNQETLISPTITDGNGQDARFNFIIDSGALTVRIINPGAGYRTGDTITVLGNLLSGGATPANDLTLTIGAQTKDGYTISTGGGETVTVDFMEELIDVYTLVLG